MLILKLFNCLIGLVLLVLTVPVLLRRFAGWQNADMPLAYAIGVSVAPALAGMSLLPFFLIGQMHPVFLITPLIVAPMLIGIEGFRWIKADIDSALSLLNVTLNGRCRVEYFSGGISILISFALLFFLSMPIIENDALEYAATAQFLARQGHLTNYPVTMADSQSGLYSPSMHPPIFHLALVWVQGWVMDAGQAGSKAGISGLLGQRFVSVLSYAGTGLLVFALAKRNACEDSSLSLPTAWLAVTLLICVPFLNSSVLAYGIDAPRIAAFLAAAAAVIVAGENPTQRNIVAAAILSAPAMWLHSIGLIVPVLGGVSLLFCIKGRDYWKSTSLYACVALLLGGGWYLRNYLQFGVLLSDSWPAATWLNLGFENDIAARRGLENFSDRLFNGVLRPWTEPALYGPVFWLATFSLLILRYKVLSVTLKVSLLWVSGFLLLAFISSLLGSSLAIKNPRYWLTLAPLAALAGTSAMALLWSRKGFARFAFAGIAAMSLFWTFASLAISSIGFFNPVSALTSNEAAFLQRPRFTGGPLVVMPETSEDARVLSFRPPFTAIYGKTNWLDHFDPSLEKLHTLGKEEAYTALRQRHIRWAYLPDYSPVTHSRSTFGQVLADPRFAAPIAAHRNARLFAIHDSPRDASCKTILPSPSPEVASRKTSIGDWLAGLTGIPHLAAFLTPETERTVGHSFKWSANTKQSLSINGLSLTGRFAVDLQLEGSGVVVVDAEFFHPTNGFTHLRLIDGMLSDKAHRFSAQWQTESGTRLHAIRISPLAPTKGEVRLGSAQICSIAE